MPLTHQGRVVVENLSVDGPIEDVQTLKRVKGNLVQMALGAVPPIMVSKTDKATHASCREHDTC